jgi:putative transposase
MSPEILVGHRYLWRHLEVVIESIERDRCVVKYERDGKEVMRSVRQSEIEAIPEHPDFDDHPLALIDPGDWRQANERATELEKIAALTSGKSEAVAAAATKLGLSGRQVWRLLTIYEQNPTKTALLAGRPGRPFDLRLLGTAREDLIAECIETHYLREERPTVKALWRAIEARCGERGLTVPSYRTVRRRVERLALKMATRRRRGTKAAGELCDGVPGSLAVPHLLDRVEIDHTLVDVILRADTPRREVVGRPWLTVAVDCRSRMVLGFYSKSPLRPASPCVWRWQRCPRKRGWRQWELQGLGPPSVSPGRSGSTMLSSSGHWQCSGAANSTESFCASDQ